MNPTPPYSPSPGMPQLPRDHDQASVSELVPFTSKKISLWRSPLTYFVLLAAILGPLILLLNISMGRVATQDALKTFVQIAFAAVFFVVFMIALLIYFYAQPKRPSLPYAWAFGLIFLLMIPSIFGIPFMIDLFIAIFRSIPGTDPHATPPGSGVVPVFIANFVGAGLMEELFKAIPILIGLAIAIRLQRRPGPASPVASFFAIRGPLDAVLLGVFAGAAFILVETAGQYLPDALVRGSNRGANFNAGLANALLLYFTRVIGGAVGHIAYSAVFGYFIGLALLRRKQMVPLILGGWLASSWLHALWNSSGEIDGSGNFFFVSAGLAAVCLVAVVLKARQLHVSRYGDAGDTMGSVIIDRSGGGRDLAPALPGYPGMPPAQPAYAGYAPGAAPFPPYAPAPTAGDYGAPPQAQPFAGYASNAQPQAPAQPVPVPADAERPAESETPQSPVALLLAGQWLALEAGTILNSTALPGLASYAGGTLGEVVPHPSRPGVLGLRNAGTAPWTAYLRDGSSQQIDRDQNIRLAPGVRIDFGGGLTGDVVPRA